MKIIRTFALVALFTVGFGLPSCTDECGCPPVEGEYFSIQDLRLTSYEQTPDGSLKETVESDTVNLENYLLNIAFETKYVSFHPHENSASFSLINSAYACSCLGNGMSGAKEKVESLQLVTLNTFDAQHQAGDTVTSFFVVDYYGPSIEPEEFFQQHLWEEQYFLKLKEKPVSNEPLQLKLILTLDNGMVLEAQSKAVVIQ